MTKNAAEFKSEIKPNFCQVELYFRKNVAKMDAASVPEMNHRYGRHEDAS